MRGRVIQKQLGIEPQALAVLFCKFRKNLVFRGFTMPFQGIRPKIKILE
jgi:hypothetical protein